MSNAPVRLPLCVLLAVTPLAFAADPPRYEIVDLGRISGGSPYPHAISNTGRVVLSERDSNGVDRSFTWENGVTVILPFLPNTSRCIARSISENGRIGGSCGPFTALSGTIWTQNGPESIGTLGGTLSDIMHISERGNVAGYSRPFTDQNLWHGFAIIDGVMHDMGPMPMYDVGAAFVINDSGRVAGAWTNHKGQNVPFIWDLEHGIRELATLGGIEAGVNDINNAGQVAGHANDGLQDPGITIPKQLPVRWEPDGRIVALPISPDKPTVQAYGINVRGECVGMLNNYATGAAAAVLWVEGNTIDLQTAIPAGTQWVLKTATDINDAGQIVGVGTLAGADRAFLLRQWP